MQLGESWLLRLLVAAAERCLEQHEGLDEPVPGLLPPPRPSDEGLRCNLLSLHHGSITLLALSETFSYFSQTQDAYRSVYNTGSRCSWLS